MRQWNKALNEFVNELKEKYGNKVEEIVVFGSYARGTAREDSDIDVLIVGNIKLDEVIDISFPILLKYGVYIAPIVMTRGYYEYLKSRNSSFIKNILREGVPLYGRV